MHIRTLEKSDLPALLKLYEHLHFEINPLPPQQLIEDIWTEILGNHRIKYFGYFERNQLISSCTISITPNLTRGFRPYGLIENVVTHQDHRKRGYGKQILNAALNYAWSVNCYKVMLLTGRKDEATLNFYESAGFDPNGKQAFIAKPAT
ncbi:GNAT family N-acetyltransferase [Deefgea tanakiae]|uniref:GNAT family N-acetyltransferase n=1 Tax=Deefgea tanakiae TaxID=2865840 RepID=A0ABX8Z8Y5_9NEIS|nr:GNAT family N-acetyltransferase [Deefgea tanakiae]QZA79041.1 GNAT family N-acetyltransferase [Deefgea tanakiae]